MNEIKTALKDVFKRLKVKPLLTHSNSNQSEIDFDWRTGKHKIKYANLLGLLHELIHALHWQELPNQFSSRVIQCSDWIAHGEILEILNNSRDWFVYAEMRKLCPTEFKNMIDIEISKITYSIEL